MLFNSVNDFYNKIKGKKVAFIGIGVSHRDLIRICAEKGALVTLCDKRETEKQRDWNREKARVMAKFA